LTPEAWRARDRFSKRREVFCSSRSAGSWSSFRPRRKRTSMCRPGPGRSGTRTSARFVRAASGGYSCDVTSEGARACSTLSVRRRGPRVSVIESAVGPGASGPVERSLGDGLADDVGSSHLLRAISLGSALRKGPTISLLALSEPTARSLGNMRHQRTTWSFHPLQSTPHFEVRGLVEEGDGSRLRVV